MAQTESASVPAEGLLQTSWQRAWSGVGARGAGATLCAQLLARYAEPQRKYHTQQHLGECLAAFERARDLAERPGEVELALWFHDAVYEVTRHDNEEQSAQWARRELLADGVAEAVAQRVYLLVMATRHTAVPTLGDEQLLVDIDLSILGADAARFAQYEQQIRDEYAFVPAWLFRRKRKAILQTFLDRPRIFSTDTFHTELEPRARANLSAATGGAAR